MTTLKERFDKDWESKFGGIEDKPVLDGQGKNELALQIEGWEYTLAMQAFAKVFFRQEFLALADEIQRGNFTASASAHIIRSKADELV